jgi:hypothetical protein
MAFVPGTCAFGFEKSFTKKKVLRESGTEDALVHQHGEWHDLHKALKTKGL